MKSATATHSIATTGLGHRLDPVPPEFFNARISAADTSAGHYVYDLIEVEPDTGGYGYRDKDGGITVLDAWEMNDTALSIGAVVRARFRSWTDDGPKYEIIAAGGGTDGLGLMIVDVVHVVARYFGPSGQTLYRVRRVDRGVASVGRLRESYPVVEYAGVYEAQGRDTVVDDPGTVVTHELPLYLDAIGVYFFQIDQHADGDANPDAEVPGWPGFYGPVEPSFPGHVSDLDQVMGDGVKGFRRAVHVNLSKARPFDANNGPDPDPVFTIRANTGVGFDYAMTVYPHNRAAELWPPLEVHSYVKAGSVLFWGGGGATGGPNYFWGWYGGERLDQLGVFYWYSLDLSGTGNPALSLATFQIDRSGGPTYSTAYAIRDDQFYRGIYTDLTVQKLGGGWSYLKFYGGILVLRIDEDGTIINGGDVNNGGVPGVGVIHGSSLGEYDGSQTPPAFTSSGSGSGGTESQTEE